MNLIGTVLVYAGLLGVAVGFASLLRPLTFLGVASRFGGLLTLACGIALFLIGEALPASEKEIRQRQNQLDEFLPKYQFQEFHSLRIPATPERVFRALQQVSADEILFFRALTWIRRLGRPEEPSILNAPPGEPLLGVAARTGFMKLAEEPDREVVLGMMVIRPTGWRPEQQLDPSGFKALRAPGFAPAAINFRIENAGNAEVLLTTETRVWATDASTSRRFARYWRVIYPGSALIRVMWLRAIKRRAESAPD